MDYRVAPPSRRQPEHVPRTADVGAVDHFALPAVERHARRRVDDCATPVECSTYGIAISDITENVR